MESDRERERETKRGVRKRGKNRISTVNIQGVDRKTGTPYNILQAYAAMLSCLSVFV